MVVMYVWMEFVQAVSHHFPHGTSLLDIMNDKKR